MQLKTDPITFFPFEIVVELFHSLTYLQLYSASLVSKKWYEGVTNYKIKCSEELYTNYCSLFELINQKIDPSFGNIFQVIDYANFKEKLIFFTQLKESNDIDFALWYRALNNQSLLNLIKATPKLKTNISYISDKIATTKPFKDRSQIKTFLEECFKALRLFNPKLNSIQFLDDYQILLTSLLDSLVLWETFIMATHPNSETRPSVTMRSHLYCLVLISQTFSKINNTEDNIKTLVPANLTHLQAQPQLETLLQTTKDSIKKNLFNYLEQIDNILNPTHHRIPYVDRISIKPELNSLLSRVRTKIQITEDDKKQTSFFMRTYITIFNNPLLDKNETAFEVLLCALLLKVDNTKDNRKDMFNKLCDASDLNMSYTRELDKRIKNLVSFKLKVSKFDVSSTRTVNDLPEFKQLDDEADVRYAAAYQKFSTLFKQPSAEEKPTATTHKRKLSM